MSILDVDVIKKAGSTRNISTPVDDTGIYAIRIKEGRLQYTRDGKHWRNIKIDDIDIIPGKDVIIDEDGRPERPTGEGHHGPNIIIDENN